MICEGTLSGVEEGYSKMKALISNNTFNRNKIRATAVLNVENYRAALVGQIGQWIKKSGVRSSTLESEVHSALFGPGSHKGYNYRNMWVKEGTLKKLVDTKKGFNTAVLQLN